MSIDQKLVHDFDALIARQGYPTRSKAIADLMRQSMVQEEWKSGKDVAAVIVMVYDHHKRNLSHNLTHVQHDHHEMIISSQHIHLDHDNCLEMVVVRGKPKCIENLANKLKATKGVKFCALAAAATGEGL